MPLPSTPYQVLTSTLYARLNASKNEEQVLAYLYRLRTKSIGLFDSVNTSIDATPAKVLLSQGRSSILWKVLDSPEYRDVDLTQVHGKMSSNLIGAAAKVNNVDFIREWKRRGLPLQDKAWHASPLSLAITSEHNAAVVALSEEGADWFGEYGAETTTNYWEAHKGCRSNKTTIKSTSAWALGVSSSVSEIAKLALSKKSNPSSEDWRSKVFAPDDKKKRVVKLNQLIGELLGSEFTVVPGRQKDTVTLPSPRLLQITVDSSGILLDPRLDERPKATSIQKSKTNFYQESWWKTWRLSGLLDQFKEMQEGKKIDWAKVYDGASVPNHVYRALAVGVEKPVTPEALRQCLDAFVGKKGKNELLSHLTSARAKALWSETSPLADEVYKQAVTVRSYNQYELMPLFPSVVFKNISEPLLWKDGANNPKLVRQFWNTFKLRQTNVPNEGRPYVRRTAVEEFTPRYGLPIEFDVGAKKSKRKAVFKALDAMAQDVEMQKELPTFLKETLSTPNALDGRTPVVSGDFLLEIGVPILWGLERGLLNAKDTHKLILSATESLSEYRKAQAAEWISEIERFRLTAKVNEKVNIPKPTFEGAL